VLIQAGDNVWAIILVGKSDGRVIISSVNAPAELHVLVKEALQAKAPPVIHG